MVAGRQPNRGFVNHGALSIKLGAQDPRVRRNAGQMVGAQAPRVAFPLVELANGQIGLAVDPKSALGVDPNSGLVVRTDETLQTVFGSPGKLTIRQTIEAVAAEVRAVEVEGLASNTVAAALRELARRIDTLEQNNVIAVYEQDGTRHTIALEAP